ncbi:hypothetical protein [Parapedobacter tibetensis]|uniref:hypothetical protein n=1 Tax=Parapedobacter tibetensis TaxID=2972951 RepID=UPI00214D2DF8|nr:hypothetical protein [Parapedobacter tibetensis]
MMRNKMISLCCCTFCLVIVAFGQQNRPKLASSSDGSIKIPMEEAYWQSDSGKVAFEEDQAIPTMRILPKAGLIQLKDFDFSTGTIEFDWRPTDPMFSSFYFRHHSAQESECVYLRTARAGNPMAMDAVQYAPFLKGVNLWDLLGHFQGSASFSKTDWNRVKLVISEKQLQVYINDLSTPVLWIPQLEGNVSNGTLAFNGESIVANLTVKPGIVDGLPSPASMDPTANDPRYLRQWLVSEPEIFHVGLEPVNDDFPKSNANWTDIQAERRGLVNLTRPYGITKERRLVWLKTHIHSSSNQQKQLDFGFSDEVWLMVNGQYVYIDKNYYGHPIMKPPFGRCSIENASIKLPLKEGDNEVLVGVANNFYGWGIVARLDDLDGITF